MIDFKNAAVLKLKPAEDPYIMKQVTPMLIEGETVFQLYRALRDCAIFTSHRIIVANVQGMTGKKIDFTSLPYSKIQAYSVESAGTLDLDAELELWFSGLGKVKLDFVGKTDIAPICRFISEKVL